MCRYRNRSRFVLLFEYVRLSRPYSKVRFWSAKKTKYSQFQGFFGSFLRSYKQALKRRHFDRLG